MLCRILIATVCAICIFESGSAMEPANQTIISGIWKEEDGTRGFVITAVQRSDGPPWLFYATRLSESPQGHRVEMSSAHDDVIIDGRRFSHMKGCRQVVTKCEGKMSVRRVKSDRYCSLKRVKNNLEGLEFSDVQKVLADVRGKDIAPELPRPREPAVGRDSDGNSSPPAR